MKLLKEYESVSQKDLLSVESVLKNASQLQHVGLYFVVSGLKIIGHENPDNNLESLCISLRVPYIARVILTGLSLLHMDTNTNNFVLKNINMK
jgi:hypothetical protein